jgi:hypothetical protein
MPGRSHVVTRVEQSITHSPLWMIPRAQGSDTPERVAGRHADAAGN